MMDGKCSIVIYCRWTSVLNVLYSTRGYWITFNNKLVVAAYLHIVIRPVAWLWRGFIFEEISKWIVRKSGKSSLHLRAKNGEVPHHHRVGRVLSCFSSRRNWDCWCKEQIYYSLSFDAYSYVATGFSINVKKLEKCEENVKIFLLQTDTGSKGGEGKERVIWNHALLSQNKKILFPEGRIQRIKVHRSQPR
jgi:hypothetical protein